MDGALLRAVLVLAFAVVAVGVLAYVVRRLASARVVGQLPVRILARQPLSSKASLVIVEVGDRRLLLGVTDSTVTLLETLSSPASTPPQSAPPPSMRPTQKAASQPPTPQPAELSFRAYLSSLFQQAKR